jgi:glycosyltransferase involved in cell wall biosynthesis
MMLKGEEQEIIYYLMPRPPERSTQIESGVDRYLYILSGAQLCTYQPVDDFVTCPRPNSEAEPNTETPHPGTTVAAKVRPPSKRFGTLKLLVGYTRQLWQLRRELSEISETSDGLIHVNRVGCELEPIAARLAGFSFVVTTVHNLPGEDPTAKHWLRRGIEWLSFACADHHICVSEATFDAWRDRVGLRRGKVTVIYNGMDEPDYSDFDRDAYRRSLLPDHAQATWVGMCARLHPMKGHSVLLEAWATLLRSGQCKNQVLVLAGSGPLDSELKEQVRALELEKSVHFLGHRTDALEFARAIDLNILPSVHSETLGYGLIEAMFAGRPSVVSDVGGMKELVTASQGGRVVPARDASALAQAIIDYTKAPELMQADGLRAQCYAREHLTAKKMAEATLGVYASF